MSLGPHGTWKRRPLMTAASAVLALLATVAVVATAAPAQADAVAVWVGSPVNGTWPANADSLPASHHIAYGGDWSVDLQNVSVGQAVQLYAAPQNGSASISAQIERVAPACASGVPAHGGYVVTVGIYNGNTKVGVANYAHIQPSVSQGQWVNRWGSTLGTVGSYGGNPGCWDGVHVHYEMYSQQHYACYNRGYQPGQGLAKTNFIGFMGGNYASGQRQACP